MPPSDEESVTADDSVHSEGSFSREEIRRAVTEVLPDAEVREATLAESGKNTVYFLEIEADESGRELVLKVGDHDFPAGCRAEPHLMEAVAERTEIPVPTVLGTGHVRERPYFLAERVSGVTPAFDPGRLGPEQFERVCTAAGRNLGDLHASFPADTWGMLGLERGADELHVAREFPDWPTYFEAWLSHNAERLGDTRFADLVPAVETRVAEIAAELREYGPFDPVVTHGDYRLGNLLVDPETGATEAVVDWATPTAVTAVHDITVTEAILLDWPEVDDDRQRDLRNYLFEGYREANPEVLDCEGFEARRRCCLLGARLRLMVNLGEEMTGRSADAVDARAREHREALREFGVG